MSAVLRGKIRELVRLETPAGVVFEFWVDGASGGALARATERILRGIQEGDVVEVSGERDANGVVQAETLIKVPPEKPVVVIEPPPRRPSYVPYWLGGVILLGLWPFVLMLAEVLRGDDPFLVNPLVIAGGLLLMAFVWPTEPQTAVSFATVPHVLNLLAMGLTFSNLDRYFGRTEGIMGVVAFVASLFLVWAISKKRYNRGTERPATL